MVKEITAEVSQIDGGNDRVKVLQRISEYESLGGDYFFENVEDDPEFGTLMPDDVDYLCKKAKTKFNTAIAHILMAMFSGKIIKQHQMSVEGLENLQGVEGGAILTSNHFDKFENLAVQNALNLAGKRGRLYKIVREGNFFMPGIIGFLLKYCDTLPLSSNVHTMQKLSKAISAILERGDYILIYPEQSMWWNYKKPRPFKKGAFRYAAQNGVPVVPCFVTMSDMEQKDSNGYPLQKYTLHVMPPLYPDKNKSVHENTSIMMEANAKLCRDKYEQIYGEKPTYLCDEK